MESHTLPDIRATLIMTGSVTIGNITIRMVNDGIEEQAEIYRDGEYETTCGSWEDVSDWLQANDLI